MEKCGHFFCVKCLYSYARTKLKLFKQQKKIDHQEKENKDIEEGRKEEEKGEEKEKEKEKEEDKQIEKQKRERFQIFCPLPTGVCGVPISKNDLKTGLSTFGSDDFEGVQMV